jgi:hypothetical protein
MALVPSDPMYNAGLFVGRRTDAPLRTDALAPR